MDEKSLREFVDRSQQIIEKASQMDEANTKSKILRPFIEDVLGWDFFSDVELEYSVKITTSRISKVDYALIKDNEPVIFIEAKGCDTNISESDRQQLSSYMKQKDVDWGLITNGECYEILKRKVLPSSKVSVKKLITFRLDNLESKMNYLQLLSKDAVHSETSEKIANKLELRRKTIDKLEEEKENISDEIIRIISNKVGTEFTQKIEDHSKKLIDNLIDDIERPFQEGISIGSSEPTKDIKIKSELSDLPNGEVIVCPSNLGKIEDGVRHGIEFLKYHNAWGFINVGREPDYLAIYVTKPVQEVKYFGEIEEIIDPKRERSPVENFDKHSTYSEGKELLLLKEESLRELENPIPFEGKNIFGPRYTTLDKLRKATTTEDLWD